jgi:hypothetical protein
MFLISEKIFDKSEGSSLGICNSDSSKEPDSNLCEMQSNWFALGF